MKQTEPKLTMQQKRMKCDVAVVSNRNTENERFLLAGFFRTTSFAVSTEPAELSSLAPR